jgi:hypothetical protein
MKIPEKIRMLVFRVSTPAAGRAGGPGGERVAPAYREAELPDIPSPEAGPEMPEDPGSRPDIEIAEQIRIAGLWKDQWREYAVEEYRFRLRYGKSCRCDVCGKYREELFLYRDRTCCMTHLPAERRPAERKTRAGRHGS